MQIDIAPAFRRLRAIIEVGSMIQKDRLVVKVRGNEVGLSMKYADEIFGVLQRLHWTEDFECTGVGRAVVQGMLHGRGSRAWVLG